MLVFISDLHLTDGTTCETISPDAFALFVEDLEWMASQACRRRYDDGSSGWEPLQRVDLILLGDILDALRTDSWYEGEDGLRPWTPEMADADTRAEAHAQLAKRVADITRAIVTRNQQGLDCFRQLARDGIRVASGDGEITIPFKIWYLPGNHDWFYNVGLPEYHAARQLLVDAIGLAHPANQPFPHTLEEAPAELREVFAQHKVFAQHGDLYDAENYQLDLEVDDDRPGFGRRAHSSIGDVFVIELLNGLPQEIRDRLDKLGDPLANQGAFLKALEEIDNVRPTLAIPQWLAALLQRYETHDPAQREREKARRKAVHDALGSRLETLLAEPFVKRLDKPWRRDTIDQLQTGKLLNSLLPLSAMSKISRWAEVFDRPLTYRDYAKARLQEIQREASENQAEIIVFGHTHHPEVVPLDLDQTRGWVYINTGTWRRVHERCAAEERQLEFLSFHVMSFAAVYQGSERGGRPYETWTGTLGSRPTR
jgi:UDP-2,3-diacylglucosamine pyrophosphatase LpxH